MKRWIRRLRGMLGMGLLWAVGMAGVGGVIELLANVLPGGFPMASAVDMWPQTLAIIGFIGGVIFAIVLGIAEGRHRFDELSLPRFTAWGAVAGFLLGLRPALLGAPVFFLGITTIGSAIAAACSLALARRADDRELLTAHTEVERVGLTEAESRQLLGRRP